MLYESIYFYYHMFLLSWISVTENVCRIRKKKNDAYAYGPKSFECGTSRRGTTMPGTNRRSAHGGFENHSSEFLQ